MAKAETVHSQSEPVGILLDPALNPVLTSSCTGYEGANESEESGQFKRAFPRLRMIVSSIRLIPHLMLLLSTEAEDFLRADMRRWAELCERNIPCKEREYVSLFIMLMTFRPEFRNIFYLRLGAKASVFGMLCPPLAALEIERTTIGPGLYIQHGSGTFISAASIGANCWINQQVTIGYSNKTDRPVIGNNVRICAGAKIVGKIRIGDNATVGLNSVVIDNVPANSTVFGVPARTVWDAKQR